MVWLTHHITGSKKQSDEELGAELFAVRMHMHVRLIIVEANPPSVVVKIFYFQYNETLPLCMAQYYLLLPMHS